MLTRLLPDQVSNFWDVIKYAIEESAPPIAVVNPNMLNNILMSILSNKTQCWVSYRRENEKLIFEAVALTKILYDDVSDTRNLLIYCIYGYENTVEESWMSGFLAIAKFAKSQNCHQIIAYSNIPYIVQKAKKYGANTDFTFIALDIPKTSKKILNDEIVK